MWDNLLPNLSFHKIVHSLTKIAFIQSKVQIDAHFHTKLCDSWFYLLVYAFFWSHENTFSQFLCVSCVCFCFICFYVCVLYQYGHCVCVCFISCLCFNSNPSSYHAFPAVDLKMFYEYDKLSMWSSNLFLWSYKAFFSY